MVNLVYITDEQYMPEHALKSKDLLGLRVLSKSGHVVGRVIELELHPTSFKMLGVVVSGKGKVYLGKNYFEKITKESIILNIDPSIFLLSKKVLTHDGQVIGKVIEVRRKGNKNDLKELVVKSFLKKKIIISPVTIHSTANAIILTRHYHGKQKYIWQTS